MTVQLSDSAECLRWISAELATSLHDASLALERYVEMPDQRDSLSDVAEELQKVHGALRIVETHGAAILAEEMVHVAGSLFDDSIKDSREGLEALSRAMVQLPGYLERLQNGGRDIPLVLLPLLNDLRAVRGSPLLSENTLFILNLDSNIGSGATPKPSGANVVAVAKKLRPRYQAGLLGWLRTEQVHSNLATMGAVAQNIEQAASSEALHQLYWIVGAVIEALLDDGLDNSVAIKRLLGQADRYLKQLIDHGEKSFSENPPSQLVNNLLYYIARANSDGERITAVKNAFSLAEMLPGGRQLEAARDHLAGPSAQLMETVAAAIRQDLGHVKDVLDIYVRTGRQDLDDLDAQGDTLKRIADTLAMLGLGELRSLVVAERERFAGWIGGQTKITDEEMIASASVLLSIESALDSELMELIKSDPDGRRDDNDSTADPQILADSEFQLVVEAVLRECLINLSRVKESISQFLASTTQALDNTPDLLRAMNAGLLMLGKSRAVDVIDRVADYTQGDLRGVNLADIQEPDLDRLADAIVGIEYYLETLKKGRPDPWYLLDHAASCMDILRPPEAVHEPTLEHRLPELAPMETDTATPVLAAPDSIDPDLLETFIEEAREEISALNLSWPNWRNHRDATQLVLVRRSFHTLKGSGRMVGAQVIGDLSWSIEDIVNKWINGTLIPDEHSVGIVGSAVELMPALLEQLEIGTEPSVDVDALIAAANSALRGEPVAVKPEQAAPASAMDPVLYEIFRNETAVHLQTIDDYLAETRQHGAPAPLSEAVQRAWHTLSGSANMAGATTVAQIADPVRRYVRDVQDEGGSVSEDALVVFAAATARIRDIVASIPSGTVLAADQSLLSRIDALQAVPDQPEVATEFDSDIQDAVVPSAQALSDDETDNEIAIIFGDEAGELLEAADLALQKWAKGFGDRAALGELQRHLHTLKGGARMAGVSAIGDLSHEVESLLASVEAGERRGAETTAIIQESLDSMHGMAEQLRGRLPVTQATAIIGRIRALTAPASTAITDSDTDLSVSDVSAAMSSLADPAGEPTQTPDKPADTKVRDDVAQTSEADVAVPTDAAGIADPDAQTEGLAVADTETEADAETEVDAETETGGDKADVSPAIVAKPGAASDEAAVLQPLTPQWPSEPQAVPDYAIAAQLSESQSVSASADDDEPAAARELYTGESGERQEFARVSAELLDDLLNNVGEVSIYHSRLEQQISTIGFNTAELAQTVVRLREQLRKLEMETEAQILHRHQDQTGHNTDFDPLEMDRYSLIQQLSRAMAESVSDVASIQGLLEEVTRDAETLLVQQTRVTTELQDGLMRTRMVPFNQHVPRFSRLIRQIAAETGKRADLVVEGGGDLDRQVLERMLPPFEHLLRNAVVHGIEAADIRSQLGKQPTGTICIALSREGSEMVIVIRDDGAGLNLKDIRAHAAARGLIDTDARLSDQEILQLILEPGFSTAKELTQSAGRGVGMDVVANVVKQLGGSLSIQSTLGRGAAFTVRLPLTLAISQALLVRTGEEVYAIPVPTLAGVARIPTSELRELLASDAPQFDYGGSIYRFHHLGQLLGTHATDLDAVGSSVPLVLVRAGQHSTALIADEIVGSREVVVKPVGPQISAVRGVAGATILGDGSIVIILDVTALVRRAKPALFSQAPLETRRDERPAVLVVDDSITVRRVTQRFLERHDMRVTTAKDGVDAVSVMQEILPDLILLDIEMPRMDGYEVATHVRNSPRLQGIPIVMVTSRVGDKHRNRAMELGVDAYIGKPYQEALLLETIRPLLARRRKAMTES